MPLGTIEAVVAFPVAKEPSFEGAAVPRGTLLAKADAPRDLMGVRVLLAGAEEAAIAVVVAVLLPGWVRADAPVREDVDLVGARRGDLAATFALLPALAAEAEFSLSATLSLPGSALIDAD